ncbi:hypothetical protein D4764_12G0008440 [Takifugu flavidus]|uniref:Uncharacterized protein n=1 Tax=Takifugu flavidus TaxID=433684 RepID=A0A5C6PCB6_9TELE|nr:hypothetical protein D4764_12G0008440 [Takifugu flavidus]
MSWVCLGATYGGTYLEYLTREVSSEMTELLTLSMEARSHPVEETHFSHLYPPSCPFGHYPKFMTIGLVHRLHKCRDFRDIQKFKELRVELLHPWCLATEELANYIGDFGRVLLTAPRLYFLSGWCDNGIEELFKVILTPSDNSSFCLLDSLLGLWELKTSMADPHNMFGSARLFQPSPLPANPTHHQVVIG